MAMGRVCCRIVRDFCIIDFAYLFFIGYSYHSMTLLYADFGKLPGFVVLTLDNCSKVHRYFFSGHDLSFTIQCLEDDDDSTMEWKPFRDMLTFNFGPAKRLAGHLHQCIEANKAGYFRPKSDHFASFDAIIYQPEKPLVNAQITENHDHDISTRGPKLLQKLLRATDSMLQPLRPLAKKPWIILFIVPTPMHTTFTKQNFKPDAPIWRAKMKQYVLGLDKYDVFH
jgi:hypothetical protein